MRHISRLTAVVMQDQKHIQNSSNRVQRLDLIYEQLSRNYSTFDQTDDPWMTTVCPAHRFGAWFLSAYRP